VAHALGREGATFSSDVAVEESGYDLVVVGAGLSGLAAAFVYRSHHPRARVLLLDNHDDFGGHAKRNEFEVGGRTLIGYGGSQSIDGPAHYSPQSRALLSELGVDVSRFYQAFDREFYDRFGLASGIHCSTEAFTANRIVRADSYALADSLDAAAIAQLPMSQRGRDDLTRLLAGQDFLPGLDQAERRQRLRYQSYVAYLAETVDASAEVISLLKRLPNTFWGLQYDALSALEAFRLGAPGFAGLDASEVDHPYPDDEPYIFHFPDGNAGLARLLVRRLVAGIAPGESMDDIVTAPFDYERLDVPGAEVRIRLSSTAVRVLPQKTSVDVIYARGGHLGRVRGRHCILAGYHRMIPFMLPELPADQRAAMAEAVRTPLVYTNVVLRNWHAFVASGVDRLYCPTGFYAGLMLDFPVSLGGYRFPRSPDEPIVVHLATAPVPGDGSPAMEQFKAGRALLLEREFEDMERDLRRQLTDILAPKGFDPRRDILAVTVNRWPHGYAREFNELFDRWQTPPWEIARRPFEGVAIAGSDSQGRAYVDAAFDGAIRAVGDLA